MPKLVMMPPQGGRAREWSRRLREMCPEYGIALPETDEDARREITDADAAFGVVPPEALAVADRLAWIQSPAAGPAAGYYYPELVAHPVQVCNPRGVYNDHIGQHVVMYMLALARGLPYYMEAQRERRWDTRARKKGYVDLKTSTALVVGVGGIGHEIARLCNAFGMRVIGVDARWEYDPPDIERRSPDELDDALPEADFVLVATPHTPETEGMWNSARFSLMKGSAYFVNIGRGMTTRLDDLVDALEADEIAGCALDVFETEPLPAAHPLWGMENVILTPHIAVADAEDVGERTIGLFLDNARRLSAGEPLRNVVDKAMWF
ncbi:hydroxyacid dehydrogenase [Candidatus Poribacteria bacterium]|nr:hydroxyacid dehydrogenase [Candidatus Poribacteria bacterium]